MKEHEKESRLLFSAIVKIYTKSDSFISEIDTQYIYVIVCFFASNLLHLDQVNSSFKHFVRHTIQIYSISNNVEANKMRAFVAQIGSIRLINTEVMFGQLYYAVFGVAFVPPLK